MLELQQRLADLALRYGSQACAGKSRLVEGTSAPPTEGGLQAALSEARRQVTDSSPGGKNKGQDSGDKVVPTECRVASMSKRFKPTPVEWKRCTIIISCLFFLLKIN